MSSQNTRCQSVDGMPLLDVAEVSSASEQTVAPVDSVADSTGSAPIDTASITLPQKLDNVVQLTRPASSPDPKTITVPGAAKGGEEGKGGVDSAPFTSFTLSNAAFLGVLFDALPDGASPLVVSKAGDPQQGPWIPVHGRKVDEVYSGDLNTYFNCASFRRAEDGSLAARKDTASAYHVLMLDDVGTKVDRSLLGDIRPTWELETSPGNFQIGFKLKTPLTDVAEIDRLQRAVADAGLTDKGALGMARWARLPNGINGKPKYVIDGVPFSCRLHVWNPNVTYDAAQLLEALAPVSKQPKPASTENEARRSSRPPENEVYLPRSSENPVISAFKERGLYKRKISDGRHDVTCPWSNEHTDGLDTGAAYFEPSSGYPSGGFRCLHSHGEGIHIGKVLEQFGLTPSQGRGRAIIRVTQGELSTAVDAAEQVMTGHGSYFQSGGFIVEVNNDPISGDASISQLSEASLTLALSDACDWEKMDGRTGKWCRADPPERNVRMLLRKQAYKHLPPLRGLARQPFYRSDAKTLVMKPGYDSVSRCLGVFDAAKFPLPERTKEAARRALELIRSNLIGEFHFAKPVDEAATLCAIFTAVTRPALGVAPAFHVRAPSSGTGKSYLCQTIAKFAGPGFASKVSYPKSSEEATKSVLSLLLSAPAVLEFDDMDSDWIPHGPINRMLTAESITERVLGFSKTATASTSVLVLGSGNNVGPIRDLSRRVITINLNAKSATPATLAYTGNPYAEITANRERYVSAVLTIIEAWRAEGCPKSDVPSIASYGGAWSDLCRHPLIWLGLPDPAQVLIDQVQADPDSDVLQRLLEEWYRAFGDKPLTLRKVLQDAYDGDLQDALMELPVVERGSINKSKLGWFLKRNQDRIIGDYTLQKAESSERNAWRVVRVGDGATPPLPPLPSSGGPAERPTDEMSRPDPENKF